LSEIDKNWPLVKQGSKRSGRGDPVAQGRQHLSAYELGDDEQLTRRELEVIVLLGMGLSHRGVGTFMGISHETVKSHLRHAAEKLGFFDGYNAAGVYAAAWRRYKDDLTDWRMFA